METIQSDNDFKVTLSRLPLAKQRLVGSLFLESVIDLTDSIKVRQALDITKNADASSDMLSNGFQSAKSAALETYTLCGRDADWLKQASHFVASAAAVCLTPEEQVCQSTGIAWTAATNARMARVCENIAHGRDEDNAEAVKQYEILQNYLGKG